MVGLGRVGCLVSIVFAWLGGEWLGMRCGESGGLGSAEQSLLAIDEFNS